MIEIQNLSRRFGNIRAVDDISFEIAPGEIIGFLGPNGAGKTTTMRMMVGYLQPSGGSIRIDGISIFDDPIGTSRKIGYLPENNPLYDELTVYEFLDYIAALREIRGELFQQRLQFVTENCGLQEVLHQKIGTLSKGYRQRTGLAQAILHDPQVLILDEPTSGLDPNQIIDIRELIRNLGKEKTLILSSHIMQEVTALCDRIIIISNGRLVANDSQENLVNSVSKTQLITLELEAQQPDLSPLTQDHPDIRLLEQVQDGTICRLTIEGDAEQDLRRILAQFAQSQGWLVVGINSQKQTLEDIFVNLTKSGTASVAEPAEPQTEEAETQPEEDAESETPETTPEQEEAALPKSSPEEQDK